MVSECYSIVACKVLLNRLQQKLGQLFATRYIEKLYMNAEDLERALFDNLGL